mgnify:CR=1 FL=1|jgi:hypothetical protein
MGEVVIHSCLITVCKGCRIMKDITIKGSAVCP